MGIAGDEVTEEERGEQAGGDGLCQATARDGKPCRAPCLIGERFCFMHSPRTEKERLEAARRGGATTSNRRRLLLGRLRFGDLGEIRDGRQALASAVIQGNLPPARATVVAGLLRDAEAALIQYELERRVGAVEELLRQLEADGEA